MKKPLLPTPKIDFKSLIKKINQMKKSGTVDLSTEEDLSIAVMNLVSLEEHFFFTAGKTGKDEYFDLLSKVREMRKTLLGRLIDQHEGETWCVSKHLLAATMRLVEVGTKLHGDGKKDDAKKIFSMAQETNSLFWGLRLKLISTKGIKKIGDDKLDIHDAKGNSKQWNLTDIVNKMVDCCEE